MVLVDIINQVCFELIKHKTCRNNAQYLSCHKLSSVDGISWRFERRVAVCDRNLFVNLKFEYQVWTLSCQTTVLFLNVELKV